MEDAAAKYVGAANTGREETQVKTDYATLFWLFMAGSVLGFIAEGLWCVLTDGHWESHSSTVWGPFCIIYGFGAVAVYLISGLLRGRGLAGQFVAFSVSGAAVEFLGSLLQELCFGSVSWDYSAHALNLGGRVSFKMALMWGVLGVAFIRLVFPALRRVLSRIQGNGARAFCVVMSMFMAVNLAVTSAAILRWRDRNADVGSPFVQWIDSTYDDSTMARIFPNMVFTDR